MLGAILGDIIGSPYEFDQDKEIAATKAFPLFGPTSQFTDDTVMTIAVCEGLLNGYGDRAKTRKEVIRSMRAWGAKYPDAGYGERFGMWLFLEGGVPYNSYGNGSAMRVSSVAWLYDDLETVLDYAKITAEVTHNHPEGVKGAQATAAAIYLARIGMAKNAIKSFIEENFNYDLSRTIDQIRPTYHHVESCQGTVPPAITAFLEAGDFEDVIRTAVSLGGDADTLTAIAGSIAEGFYGVPSDLVGQVRARLPEDMLAVLNRFEARKFC